MTDTAPALESWVGRTETAEDTLDLRPARLMQSILPHSAPLQTGDVLPPLWNWLYFHQPAPLDQLGRDGHPKKGGFLPPVDLPRRMWAGGRFEFPGDLRIGEAVQKRSEILKVAQKEGRSGRLCFVTVEHRYLQGGETLWREEHDIVYREDPAPGQPKPAPAPAPEAFTEQEVVQPSIVMLFRYSALTFNGHRIHYDRPYCREVEGYPDLVFHGPLTATFLADFARRKSEGRMESFSFRAVSPLFDTADFGIYLSQNDGLTEAWACTPEGHLAMKAEARFS
ncbi:MaoC family dehydratase N-terminal domain-containing protein [Vannielia litorea]|uniref:FAS1-like dehydratase domain-containing protein n=1 Tax=Vannielia litorea TaxID=1217970 RepID=UPI001C939E31|nr:MaoC family dehydratase N-terminal domain-containing protein [Vannielia litorea]MBY6048433.1 MaoC family dehydratase N-terminal domain-containing protein [Vannielia litorea]MBY6075847.1 MaoC family dehydratase N-terminal domain-containing protein [Vannielia litorea]